MVYLQRCSVVTWLVSRETAAVSAYSVYAVKPCTTSAHFMQSHIHTRCMRSHETSVDKEEDDDVELNVLGYGVDIIIRDKL